MLGNKKAVTSIRRQRWLYQILSTATSNKFKETTTFSSIAGRKLSHLVTSCLVLMIIIVGEEMTLRTRTISTASRPNAQSARMAMGLERRSMETCLFIVLNSHRGKFHLIYFRNSMTPKSLPAVYCQQKSYILTLSPSIVCKLVSYYFITCLIRLNRPKHLKHCRSHYLNSLTDLLVESDSQQSNSSLPECLK